MEPNIEKSHLIYFTLNELFPLSSPHISMWTRDDIYASPVFLRFKFRDEGQREEYFQLLSKVVDQFEGKLKWKIVKNEQYASYGLMPKLFGDFYEANRVFNTHDLVVFFGQQVFNYVNESAIDDVPALSKFILESIPRWRKSDARVGE